MSQPPKTSSSSFHIAMFPWFAIGHITPYLHLANELASRGHRITLLVPNKARLQLQHLVLHPDLIVFSPVAVPHVHGLPEGTEIASEIPIHMTHLLATAMDRTRGEIEQFLTVSKPDFVLYDTAQWVPGIARRNGIKTVCYNVVCAAALAIALVPARNVPKDRPITEEDLREPPAGYPSKNVVLRGAEAKALTFITLPYGEGITFYERTTTAMKECDVLSIRTCRELEGDLCDYMEAQYKKPVILTGPVLGLGSDKKSEKLEERWEKWFSGFEAGSVVFCAFGTQWILEKDQFQELVLGFELTGLSFFVALKPPLGCATIEEALPNGFEGVQFSCYQNPCAPCFFLNFMTCGTQLNTHLTLLIVICIKIILFTSTVPSSSPPHTLRCNKSRSIYAFTYCGPFISTHTPSLSPLSLSSHCRTRSRTHMSSALTIPASFIASSTFPWLLRRDLEFPMVASSKEEQSIRLMEDLSQRR